MGRTILDAQTAFTQIEQSARDLMLHISEGKIKYILATSARKANQPITPNATAQTVKIKIEDCNFETVDNFSYLGLKITTDNSYDDEIRARLLAANRAYFSLQKTVPLETSHHWVKALTVQDNDLATPHVFLRDLDS
ncbi:unnamed protein product [Hermetia illucens]|uniref:Uncharacterized protein n=1 Tax=Hermetia illucens TaxID=343691 RepID=A0A7R8UR56_HERIL|nr:unnamed protein product [Hermetia illucens]